MQAKQSKIIGKEEKYKKEEKSKAKTICVPGSARPSSNIMETLRRVIEYQNLPPWKQNAWLEKRQIDRRDITVIVGFKKGKDG